MSIASGAASFQRFYIDGPFAKDITPELLAQIDDRVFGRLATLPDETQLGWIGPRHLFDTKITADAVAYGRFVLLSMRVDSLKAPASVIKGYVRLEEEAALEASGREFLSKAERRKAREAAMIRVDQDATAGAFRRMTSLPVLLDLDRGRAYLGSTGSAAADKFMKLFGDTFKAALTPARPAVLAERLLGTSVTPRVFEQLTPSHLIPEPTDTEAVDTDAIGGDLSFLGTEFLTWLWFRTDGDDAPLRLQRGDDITLMFERSLRLKCDFDLTGTTAITATSPVTLPEAMAALRTGKQPVRGGLTIGFTGSEVRLTLDGATLSVSGLAIPEDAAAGDAREQLENRFEKIADTAELIDGLFEVFLRERTGRGWDGLLRRMQGWATGERTTTAQLRAAV